MKNILIINDDEHIGNVLEEVLMKEGYCVLRAYSDTEELFSISEIKGIPVIVVCAEDDINNKADIVDVADSAVAGYVLTFDEIMLNTAEHIVNIGKNRIKLTRTEYAILKLFMQNPGQVIKKSLMLELIGEDTPDCTEISLKVHVSNLRKKLRAINGKDYIETVWGVGFRLRIE